MPLVKTTANYGADVVFLFLGGFVLALAISRWGLDRRIAFVTLRLVGTRPKAIVAGTMGATGCCVAACGTARMREDFVGAVGLNKIGRFRLDPRDTRSDADDYELVGDDSGVFGCMSLLAVTTSVRRTCHCRHRLLLFAGRWLRKG
jgi:di/tricarboxylate transporter